MWLLRYPIPCPDVAKVFWFFFSKKNRFRFPASFVSFIALPKTTDWILA
jgi:hypothetical protein